MSKTACAIVGSGNIGTDLMYKLQRSPHLELGLVVGVDPESDGLAKARGLGIDATHDGVDVLLDRADEFSIVFEATSAWVHRQNAPRYAEAGLKCVDLTPAKLGPLVVPPVNMGANVAADNVNLITCGGQATTPIIHAVARTCEVPYAEIVSTVASLSAGPGTRQNIDEFTTTTSAALSEVGGARYGKAIMVLNPADPPILMRNTVFCALGDGYDRDAVANSILAMVDEVSQYVPGYRLKSDPVFDEDLFHTPGGDVKARVVALLEVEGAGDYFPPYAGNLDIMTASAVRVGEAMAQSMNGGAS
ncbi:MAG: acetaldehyde dehydrogenase (acetylating) [Acidimicrobiia bacterium]|nr:acetaldehyde dehydrogenase (acetylating) [Acidimicrobiia bacterium]MDH4307105.1 acetaldehyde dehydrogenase (acetylating) [Acidimicrobiia bacterium]